MWCTHTHTHSEILPNHKRDKILPFAATCIDLEDIMLREISMAEKNKCSISLICGILQIQKTSEYNKKAAESEERGRTVKEWGCTDC